MSEKDKCASTNKYRNFMLAIRSDHAKWKDLKELETIVMKLNPKKYAIIRHDKEVDEQGKPKAPDDHAMLVFKNARSLEATAKKLGVEPQNLEIWDNGVNNGFAYLLHRTKKAVDKGQHQYEPKEVLTNFDYDTLLETIAFEMDQAKIARDASPKTMLNAVYAGIMTLEEALNRLTGSQYAFYRKKFEDVENRRLQKEANKWREEMITAGKQSEFIWINGFAGYGKTRLARDIAEKRGQPYFVTGSNRDPFQGYKGEHAIIIDDFRAETMSYRDLLRLTDPFGVYGGLVNAPSRYSDKALACDLIIITSPYSPKEYYEKIFGPVDFQVIDSFDQLARRITLWLYVVKYYISGHKYNGQGGFDYVSNSQRPNPYVSTSNQAPTVS